MRMTEDVWGMLEAFYWKRRYDRPGMTTHDSNSALSSLRDQNLIRQTDPEDSGVSWEITKEGVKILKEHLSQNSMNILYCNRVEANNKEDIERENKKAEESRMVWKMLTDEQLEMLEKIPMERYLVTGESSPRLDELNERGLIRSNESTYSWPIWILTDKGRGEVTKWREEKDRPATGGLSKITVSLLEVLDSICRDGPYYGGLGDDDQNICCLQLLEHKFIFRTYNDAGIMTGFSATDTGREFLEHHMGMLPSPQGAEIEQLKTKILKLKLVLLSCRPKMGRDVQNVIDEITEIKGKI